MFSTKKRNSTKKIAPRNFFLTKKNFTEDKIVEKKFAKKNYPKNLLPNKFLQKKIFTEIFFCPPKNLANKKFIAKFFFSLKELSCVEIQLTYNLGS